MVEITLKTNIKNITINEHSKELFKQMNKLFAKDKPNKKPDNKN